MKNVFTSSYCDIFIHEDKKCVVQVWKAYCDAVDFRKAQLEAVAQFKKNSCKHFISDTTNAGMLKKEETDWAAQNVTPKLVENGMKELNIVLPQKVFTQMTIENLKKEEKGLPINTFPGLDEALNSLS